MSEDEWEHPVTAGARALWTYYAKENGIGMSWNDLRSDSQALWEQLFTEGLREYRKALDALND